MSPPVVQSAFCTVDASQNPPEKRCIQNEAWHDSVYWVIIAVEISLFCVVSLYSYCCKRNKRKSLHSLVLSLFATESFRPWICNQIMHKKSESSCHDQRERKKSFVACMACWTCSSVHKPHLPPKLWSFLPPPCIHPSWSTLLQAHFRAWGSKSLTDAASASK